MFDWIIPTIIPKMERAEAKISTIKILTNNDGSCASARAQLLPAMPTEILRRVRRGEVRWGERRW